MNHRLGFCLVVLLWGCLVGFGRSQDRRFLLDVSLQTEVVMNVTWGRMWGWADPGLGALRVLSVFVSLDDAPMVSVEIPCVLLPPCAPIRSPCNRTTSAFSNSFELWAPLTNWTPLTANVMLYATLTDGLEVGRVAARAPADPVAYHCRSAFLPRVALPISVIRSSVPISSLIFNNHPFTAEDTSQCRWATGTSEDALWLEENLLGVPNISLSLEPNDVWFIPHEPGRLVVTFDSEKKNT